MKIAVYAIALNEAAHVQRWAESARGADCIIAADTGSTDGTLAEFGIAGVPVISISIRPWRFDDARNAALALLPPDIDVCIALDLDEELRPGWRQALEQAWKPGTTRLYHPFVFTHNDDGSPKSIMYGHRIHGRHDYRWAYPIHEALMFKGDRPEQIAVCENLWIHHRPAPKPTRAQYLPMMFKAAQADPTCERMAFYYARELMFNAMWDKAIVEFKRYLALPCATWLEQREEAMRFLARCLRASGDPAATEWFLRATLEQPDSRQAWTELAHDRLLSEDWFAAVWAARTAMAKPMPKGGLYEVKDMKVGPYAIAGAAALRLRLPQAKEWLKIAVDLYPDDEIFLQNLAIASAA
jgi:glycosyltransferase involved in cell wall biosynthesis